MASSPNKSEIISTIADKTDLTQVDVGNVLDELESLIEKSLRGGSGSEFKLPGLLKIEVVTRKATKARKGRNPHTGEEITIPAKPAREAVKVKPLKKLKDMV
ncbi:MAG: HU family DNA-binding protein [Phycisphaeraceae bacterium]|nr:HU family DNA-binding protein [Phycisphaeraceae bacterium]